MPKDSPHDREHKPTFWENSYVPWLFIAPLAAALAGSLWLVLDRDQDNAARMAESSTYAQSEYEAAQRDDAARAARRPEGQPGPTSQPPD